MQVGDLVEIAKWCKNKGRIAIVVDAPDWDKLAVKIMYLDQHPAATEELGLFGSRALRQNLVLLSPSKRSEK
tara:strand:+ start:56 stop:271 length:216 start_codon:yes stop_codon:yes gene_type:complete